MLNPMPIGGHLLLTLTYMMRQFYSSSTNLVEIIGLLWLFLIV